MKKTKIDANYYMLLEWIPYPINFFLGSSSPTSNWELDFFVFMKKNKEKDNYKID